MSARTDIERLVWHPLASTHVESVAKKASDMELETFFSNLDPTEAIPPLTEVQAKPARKPDARAASEKKLPVDPGSRAQGQRFLVQHEQLLSRIKRGEECLNQVHQELEMLRSDLDEWADYERICGTNPLADYMQSISAKEQISKFLPGWLKRQREQLEHLERAMQSAAQSSA